MKTTKNVHLECAICKNRNYRLVRSKESKVVKLEVSKYCKYCQKHTLHVESR